MTGFVAALIFLVFASIGSILLRFLQIRADWQRAVFFSVLAGAAITSNLVFVLASLKVANHITYILLALIAVSAAVAKKSWIVVRYPADATPSIAQWLLWPVFTLFTVLYVCAAAAPETSPDGTTYHLGLVQRYTQAHGFVPVLDNMYAQLSQGMEMLFMPAFSFAGHRAAAFTHFLFLPLLTLGIYSYAGGVVGACAALLVYLSPVAGIDGASAHVDIAAACAVFGAFYAVQVWDVGRERRWLVLAGLLAGFSFAIKYTAAVAIVYVVGYVAFRARGKGVGIVAAMALFSVAPWVGKNIAYTGNPVAPFFNRWFPNKVMRADAEREYQRLLREYSLDSKWRLPWEVTVHGATSGVLGPIFLLAPVGLLALKEKRGRRVWAAAIVGCLYWTNLGTRFLLPVLPFIAIAMAISLRFAAPYVVLAHAILSWPSVTEIYMPQVWRIDRLADKEALGLIPQEQVLSARVPTYELARMIDQLVPPNEKVLTIGSIAEAYTSRHITVGYQSATGNELLQILYMPFVKMYQPESQAEFRFSPSAMKRIKLIQADQAGGGLWRVNDVRLFNGGSEITTATPNAFDNNPVTLYVSEQERHPGMSLELDLSTSQTIDRVVVDAPGDQHGYQLKIEGIDAKPEYRAITQQPDFRNAAINELKRRGYNYLVLHPSDFGFKEISEDPGGWGIEWIGERNGYRLYKLIGSAAH